jgi:hypothetical protein
MISDNKLVRKTTPEPDCPPSISIDDKNEISSSSSSSSTSTTTQPMSEMSEMMKMELLITEKIEKIKNQERLMEYSTVVMHEANIEIDNLKASNLKKDKIIQSLSDSLIEAQNQIINLQTSNFKKEKEILNLEKINSQKEIQIINLIENEKKQIHVGLTLTVFIILIFVLALHHFYPETISVFFVFLSFFILLMYLQIRNQ